jgi:hypothetical protein
MGHSPAVLDEFYLGVSDDDVNTGLARVEERLSISRPPAKKSAKKSATRKTAAKKKAAPASKKAASSKRAQPTPKRRSK